MAWSFNVNQTPTTGGIAMYQILTTLVAATWTVQASGDGLSAYSGAGSVFSHGGATGANGLNNTSAWFRIQCPTYGGVTREFVVQRGSSSQAWAVKYSPAAGFTTGGSATVVPTATDEVALWGNIVGGGTTYTTLLGGDGSYRLHMGMGDATVGYSFWMVTFNLGNTGTQTGWMMDLVTATDTGDTDPFVHYMDGEGSSQVYGNQLRNSGNQVMAFMGSTASANWVHCPALTWGSLGPGVSAVGTNAFSGQDDFIPVPYGKSSAPGGFKGYSTICSYYFGNSHINGDTISTLSPASKDRLHINGTTLPWPGISGAPVDCIV